MFVGETMDQVPVLVVIEGPLTGQRFVLAEGDGNTIGRSEDCTIVIPDPDVSRLHARLILRNSAVWVQDENSRNAIFVNDKRVVRRPEELRPGGQVRLGEGRHIFCLELDAADDESLVIPIEKEEEKPSMTMWAILGGLLILSIVVSLFSLT